MKHILVLGAGRSAYTLIQYLISQAAAHNWHILVAEKDLELAEATIGDGGTLAEARALDIYDTHQREELIRQADIVISMLPARLHHLVAQTCLQFRRSMVTASYVSPEIQAMDRDANEAGIIFLNEIGLDPGLDHLSAMKTIDRIRKEGYELTDFETFTGGLVAPESDNNPWNYKFTWNPRNVVIAGQGSAVKFIQEGRYKYIPYHRLFRRTEIIEIEGYGRFEGYPNRDSLKYINVYNLQGIKTLFRGTLRRPGFCRAWDAFVQLGATDDSYVVEGSEEMTHRQFINLFLSYNPHDSVELKLMHYLKLDQDSEIFEKLKWLDIFSEEKVGLKDATPAQILQHILEKKWKLAPEDKDMIVMWNKFIYKTEGTEKLLTSSMVVKGDDTKNTAMAKTVGFPVGIATKLILNREIDKKGVVIPTTADIYEPILEELKGIGIEFLEKEQ